MPVDEKFGGALIDGQRSKTHSGYRILGVRLRKFSLWHRMLLLSVESPFVKSGKVSLWDLRTAIGISRSAYPDSSIRRPWVVPVLLHLWLVIRTLLWAFWPWSKAFTLEKALKKRIDEFVAYTAAYNYEPEFAVIPPEGDNTQPPRVRGRAPESFEHVCELVGWGIPMQEAWDMPYGVAAWLRPIIKRQQGNDIDFVTPAEKEFQAKLPPEYRIKK